MKDLKQKITTLIQEKREAEKVLRAMNPSERTKLNRKLDIEHAYYSSALEGSKLDRKEFDELAKKAS